ncbi:TonB-dependent receptor [Methylobacillus arboreus]|uniref:TonB-dependent siderophore receptor n=1 Tax=Methylobacillus arboreus TaxID=755170 RepID=UPI001E4B556A|nr:TonB-dependent receptor [Methylobacillus arboreus]MCB5190718.1 TonB-dependent receptor [Methylobacillus arboreus]
MPRENKTHSFKRSTIALLLQASLATGAVMSMQATHAAEPAAAEAKTYAIAAGPLGAALSTFATQAGVLLSFDPVATQGKTTSGLNGTYRLREGFEVLLQGSGLAVRQESDGSYSLTIAQEPKASAENTLPEVRVKASREVNMSSAMTEGTGSYTIGSMRTATKMDLSIRETPQSVSVITRQRMDDQAMYTLNDVVKNTVGLTVSKWGDERPQFNSRGFQLNNLMIDGLPIFYEEAALSTGLLSQYDRVEIVRGASGLMEGVGSPGGSINLVRKRPTREFQSSLTVGAGSWDNYIASLDVSGPLNEQGTLRGRSVVSYQDKNSFQDYRENKRTLLYSILEADITTATTLSLGASYSKEDNPGANWVGMVTYPNGSFLPISRSHSMSPSWTHWDKESKTVFAEVNHSFSNEWKAKVAATYVESQMDMLGVSFSRSSDDLVYGVGSYNYDITQKSVDGMVSGPFSLMGREHELVFGVSHRVKKDDWTGSWPSGYSFILNPLDANSASSAPYPILQTPNPYANKVEVEQSSIYTSGRFNFRDDLKLIVGGRLDWYENTQNIRSGTWLNNVNYKTTRQFTPYAGLVYDLNDTYAAYVSLTRIFAPQDYQQPGGGLIDPREGTNYELGIKGEHFGGRLNTSLALFQIDLENLPTQLDVSQCAQEQTSCYTTTGKVRSRGIELEVSGEIATRWQMGAGYTYNYAENLEPSSYSQIGTGSMGKRYGTNLPLNIFKMYTTYRLPGEFDNWKIGGGIQTQSNIYTQYGVKQGGYTLVDLHAGYTFNKNIDLSLNINNLLDKRYYSGILSTASGNFFGDPRNFMLTMRYRF